jgi:hypothetical protein
VKYTTIAYNAAAGTTLWARHYPRNAADDAASIALNLRGTAVFVTGTSHGPISADYGTVAFRT